MVNSRIAGFFGICACVVFWLALFVLGSLRPSYSQSINSISELGAIGTPNATLWNIVGFILPGLCLAVAGKAIADSANTRQSKLAKLATWFLPLFGVGVAGQGLFPALMVDGAVVITSWHTRTHLIASLISGLAWIVGVLLLIGPMKRTPEWGRWYLVNIIAVLLVIVGSFGRGVGLADGLVQRIVDAIVFAWFVLMSIKLVRIRGKNGIAPAAA